MSDDVIQRVAARFLKKAAFFNVGDLVLYGKYKNSKGKVVAFGFDPKGNPTIEIEPIPKGRKQNKVFGLYKIWHMPVEKKEASEQLLIGRVAARFMGDDD